MCNVKINCDICSGKITNVSLIDTNNYELCSMCKDEETFLDNWRNERRIKKRKTEKMQAGLILIQNKSLYNDAIKNVLQYI